MNLALASVSNHSVQVERSQNHEGLELRGAPLLAATFAWQKERDVCAHVRGTTDDDPARFVLSVTATSFPEGRQ